MDTMYLQKLRVQYMARKGAHATIGGYDLFDIYLVLHALSLLNNGVNRIQTPFMWITREGGFDSVTSNQVDALSDLLVVKRIPENVTGRIVTGLTQTGIFLLKEHVKELSDALSSFSLTEEDIMNLDSQQGAYK